jgi:hypothetical protein
MLGINELKNRVRDDLALRDLDVHCYFGEWTRFHNEETAELPYAIFGLGPFLPGLPNENLSPGPVQRNGPTKAARVLASRAQTTQVWVCGERPSEDTLTDTYHFEEAQHESTAALLHEVIVSIERVTVRIGKLTWGTGQWLHHEEEGLYGAVALLVFTIQLPVFDVTLTRRHPGRVTATVTTNNSPGSSTTVTAPKP